MKNKLNGQSSAYEYCNISAMAFNEINIHAWTHTCTVHSRTAAGNQRQEHKGRGQQCALLHTPS